MSAGPEARANCCGGSRRSDLAGAVGRILFQVIGMAAVVGGSGIAGGQIEDLGPAKYHPRSEDRWFLDEAGVVVVNSGLATTVIKPEGQSDYGWVTLDMGGGGVLLTVADAVGFDDVRPVRKVLGDYGGKPQVLPDGQGFPLLAGADGSLLLPGKGALSLRAPDGAVTKVVTPEIPKQEEPVEPALRVNVSNRPVDLNRRGEILGVTSAMNFEGRPWIQGVWWWSAQTGSQPVQMEGFGLRTDYPSRDMLLSDNGTAVLPVFDVERRPAHLVYGLADGSVRRVPEAKFELPATLNQREWEGPVRSEVIYTGINGSGDLVGHVRFNVATAKTPAGFQPAKLPVVVMEEKVTPLQELLPEDSPWQLWTAKAVNNKGQVVGIGIKDGGWRYYRMELAPKAGAPYPDYERFIARSVPKVEIWGEGIPSAESNNWSKLLPYEVAKEHKLNGRWVVLAVHGPVLFEPGESEPKLAWAEADRQFVEYRYLHRDRFDPWRAGYRDGEIDWNPFFLELKDRLSAVPGGIEAKDPSPADVYVIAARLLPNIPAGRYEFKIGDLRVEWGLPESPNLASTHVARGRYLSKGRGKNAFSVSPASYVRTNHLFKHDRFFVEVVPEWEVVTTDRIPVELIRSGQDGRTEVLEFGSRSIEAVRVEGEKLLFRTPEIFILDRQTKAGWRMKNGRLSFGVPLKRGDRLAVRVRPHSDVRQGAMALSRVHTAPAEVDNSWLEAVVQAAKIAEVEVPTGPELEDRTGVAKVVASPWATVDSTPFVVVGGREVKMNVGHLAAMLMVRRQFIASMEESLPRLQKLRDESVGGKDLGWMFFWMLREDALRAGSPLGDKDVDGWDRARRIVDLNSSVKFRHAYDEEWIGKTFGGFGGHATEWRSKSATRVFYDYVTAAERALAHARATDGSDPEALLRLCCVGMGKMVGTLRPNCLRLLEDSTLLEEGAAGFRWVYEETAYEFLGLLEALGEEFLRNEAIVDEINTVTSLVAAVVAILMPETLVGAAIAAVAGGSALAITLVRDLPEYFGRKEDVEFAMGAYLAAGPARYVTAELRRKPGWQMALELVGGTVGFAADLARVSQMTTAAKLTPVQEAAADLLAQPARTFAMAEAEAQSTALATFARATARQAADETLTLLETRLVEEGTRLVDEMETLTHVRRLTEGERELAERAETVMMVDGRQEFLFPVSELGTETFREGTHQIRWMAEEAVGELARFRLPGNMSWANRQLGEELGKGVICQVLAVEGKQAVLKVTQNLDSAAEDIARVRHCSELLGKEVPQLKILDTGFADYGNIKGIGYIEQELIPDGATILRARMGVHPGAPLVGVENGRRVLGVVRADGSVGPMAQEHAVAICELYRKMIDGGLVWFDGHYGNIVLVEEQGELVAKILDQDFIWSWEQSFLQGPMRRAATQTIQPLYDFNSSYFRRTMQSMLKHRSSKSLGQMVDDGAHIYPSARFFMYKMMERWGFVHFVRDKGWVDGSMRLADLKRVFKDFEEVSVVDPDLPTLLEEAGKLPPGSSIGNPDHPRLLPRAPDDAGDERRRIPHRRDLPRAA